MCAEAAAAHQPSDLLLHRPVKWDRDLQASYESHMGSLKQEFSTAMLKQKHVLEEWARQELKRLVAMEVHS